MPWNDWQFWVVTAGAAFGLWMLIRPFLQQRDPEAGCHGCNTCPTDAPAETKGPKLVSIGRR